MITERIQQNKAKLQQLKNHITDKNLPQIQKFIQNTQKLRIPNIQWMSYLTQIFAMLTDPELQMPTFTRRIIIFNIFKIAINIKTDEMPEKESPIHFKKNLEFIIRIISGIFISITSKRAITQQQIISFHKYITKFLAITSSNLSLNSKNPQLPAEKVKILQTLYPTSSKNHNNLQFIYPDLLLWYEMFLNLKNIFGFSYYDKQKAIEHLTRILSQVQSNVEPVLLWVSKYVFLQQIIKIHTKFDESQQIQCLAVRILKLMMNSAYNNFIGFLVPKYRQKRRIQDCQNIFRCIIRFNVISSAYSIIQNARYIKKYKTEFSLALEQIKKTIQIILIACQQQKSKLKSTIKQPSNRKFYERLVKYEVQMNWILFNLDHQLTAISNNQNQKQLADFNILTNLYSKLQKQYSSLKLSIVLTQFQNTIIQEISSNRQKILYKFSQGRKMSNIVFFSSYLLKINFSIFSNIVEKVLQPKQILKFYLCLICQYYFNDQQLIIETISKALQIVQDYITHPQSITSTQQMNTFKQAVIAISLGISKSYTISDKIQREGCNIKSNMHLSRKHYICSICCKIQLDLRCSICEQPCIRFSYNWQMPVSVSQSWFQYLKLISYFVSNQIKRVQPNLAQELIVAINSVTYHRNS